MTGPRVDAADLPVVSRHRDGRDEWLVSTPTRTSLLRGTPAPAASGERWLPSEPGAGLVIDWPPPSIVCDSTGDWQQWETAEDLAAHVRGPGHHYVVATRDPGRFLTGLTMVTARCTPVLRYGNRLLVGPLLQPGRGPCGACYAHRLTTRLRSLGHRVERDHVLVPGTESVADLVATARTLWERRTPQRPLDELMILDTARGNLSHEKVIPRSECPCANGGHSPGTLEEWAGAVVGMAPEPSRPRTALALPYSVLSTRTATGGTAGAAGLDEATVRRRTLGESVERHALHTLPPGAWQALTSDTRPLNGFDGTDGPVWWVEGRRLRTGEPVVLPACLVSRAPECADPDGVRASGSGVAAADSAPAATTAALLELVERETVVTAWPGPGTLRCDAAVWAPRHHALAEQLGGRLVLTVVALPSKPPVAVAALTRDGVASYGSACDLDPARACLHAADEALLMWHADLATGEPRPWLAALDDLPAGTASVHCGLDGVFACLDPIAVDLTCPESRAVGISVVATVPADPERLSRTRFPAAGDDPELLDPAAPGRARQVIAAFGTRRPPS